MATLSDAQEITPPVAKKTSSTFMRVMQYTAVRLVTLFVTIVIGVYLTIMIANMGGHVDNIMRARNARAHHPAGGDEPCEQKPRQGCAEQTGAG
jgi:peptide/nickel transport system permease protein